MRAKPMKLVPTKGYVPCKPNEATHVQLHCPGIFPYRIIPVGGNGWQWNQDTERPTLAPSIRTSAEFGEKRESKVCHSYVTDGKIQFLGDCTHEFAGQTLDLLEVEE